MYTRIDRCRICSNTRLEEILNLGSQALSGVFPDAMTGPVARGPLQLVKCIGDTDVCGLVQLRHNYALDNLFGDHYGYRSGLNASMVKHLEASIAALCRKIRLLPGDLVIDIGSNDCTTLRAYARDDIDRVGIDPVGEKFRDFYPDNVSLVPDFFSAACVRATCPGRSARIVTSFSMFYDLETPLEFMREVAAVLAENGVWYFEQSYLPAMLAANSFDTVCQEHLEYYTMKQICWMADRVGLDITAVSFNDVNGGSFAVTASRHATKKGHAPAVKALLEEERHLALDSLQPFREFTVRIEQCKRDLRMFLDMARRNGKSVAGLGASTKGNVLLQYFGIGCEDLQCIGEVNPDKFGRVTPGSEIPIVPQDELLRQGPDYLLVLPWHFREFFLHAAQLSGCCLVFPLPRLEVIQC